VLRLRSCPVSIVVGWEIGEESGGEDVPLGEVSRLRDVSIAAKIQGKRERRRESHRRSR